MLTGVHLLDAVHRSGRTLRELAGVMTRFPQVLRNVRIGVAGADIIDLDDRLAPDLSAARDSLGQDGRILVRRSGTEPLVRVMVEAKTIEQAQAVADRHAAAVTAAAT